MLEQKAGKAFDIGRESIKLRERYGESKIAQSFLLARRLVEAGVSLVTVNWEDETKVSSIATNSARIGSSMPTIVSSGEAHSLA